MKWCGGEVEWCGGEVKWFRGEVEMPFEYIHLFPERIALQPGGILMIYAALAGVRA